MKKLLLFSITFTIIACSSGPKNYVPDFSTDTGKKDFANKAFIIAKDLVIQNLKSPSTAKFSMLDFS